MARPAPYEELGLGRALAPVATEKPPPPPEVAAHFEATGHGNEMVRDRRPKREEHNPKPNRVNRYANGCVAAGGYHTCVIDNKGRLFAFGCNAQGQLGLGHTDDAETPQEVRGIEGLVEHVSCGASHTAAVDAYGRLWTWGYGKSFLGHKPTQKPKGALLRMLKKSGGDLPEQQPNFLEPTLVPSLLSAGIRVRHVSCGWTHSAATTDTYDVYTWGRGDFGKLGHADEESVYEPKLVRALANQQVHHAACGAAHTAFLTRQGTVFCCGQGSACGAAQRGKVLQPVEVTALSSANEQARQVAAGAGHTVCLTAKGEVYSWGWNKVGQLGTGTRNDAFSPVKVSIPVDSPTLRVACGAYHTVLALTTGELITFGAGGRGEPDADGKSAPVSQNGELGRLGVVGDEEERRGGDRLFPKVVAGPWRLLHQRTKLEHIAAGGYHTVLVTEVGEVFTCGVGLNGRLGHGDLLPRVSPTFVASLVSLHARLPVLVNDGKPFLRLPVL